VRAWKHVRLETRALRDSTDILWFVIFEELVFMSTETFRHTRIPYIHKDSAIRALHIGYA